MKRACAGASDVSIAQRSITITTESDDWGKVRDELMEKELELDMEVSGLKYEPVTPVKYADIAEDDAAANRVLVDRLLELDDVDAVYSQMEATDDDDSDD